MHFRHQPRVDLGLLGLLPALLAFTLMGVLVGLLAGLVPGIHMNTVAALLLAGGGALLGAASGLVPDAPGLAAAAFIMGALVAHTIAGVVPSVYLGAPQGENVLSVLPGHRLLLAGEGWEGVRCSVLGAVGGALLSLALLPLVRLFMGDPVNGYDKMVPAIPLVLGTVSSLLVLTEMGTPGPFRLPLRGHRLVLHEAEEVLGPSVWKGRGPAVVAGGTGPLRRRPPIITPAEMPDHLGRDVVVMGEVVRSGEKSFTLRFEKEEVEVVVPPARVPDLQPGLTAEGKRLKIVARVGAVLGPALHLKAKGWALLVFLISGLLGAVVLASPLAAAWGGPPVPGAPADPSALLLPLFTGLFGLPTILLSMSSTGSGSLPPERPPARLPLKRLLRGVLSGTAAGALLGFYPAVSSSQASTLAKFLGGEDSAEGDRGSLDDSKEFMAGLAAVGMSTVLVNLAALFTILRARSGVMHAVGEVLGGADPWSPASAVPAPFAALVFSLIVAVGLAAAVTLVLGRRLARLLHRLPYRPVARTVAACLVLAVALLTGPLGLAIMAVALCIGLVPPLVGVRRVHLMGALVLPVILYYSGWGVA